MSANLRERSNPVDLRLEDERGMIERFGHSDQTLGNQFSHGRDRLSISDRSTRVEQRTE
jgi:hypothetical protein